MTTDLVIRAAIEADMEFFYAVDLETTWESIPPGERDRLDRRALAGPITAATDELLSHPGTQIIIAENCSGQRLGMLWLGTKANPLSGFKEAWVYSVGVIRAQRGKGIGKALMRHAEVLAQEQGFSRLGLMVSRHNGAACRFYADLGFEATSVILAKEVAPG